MGGGTTGEACAGTGRKFIGIERERRYFDLSCERISRAQAQGQLLPHDPPAAPEQVGLALEPNAESSGAQHPTRMPGYRAGTNEGD